MDYSSMYWLTSNLYELPPAPWASAVLVFTSPVCGGLVGVEFEHKQKSVGIHPLTFVCFGSTLFTMATGVLRCRTPIAAQIFSGGGFLGAGVILRGLHGITTLTSVTTIWAVAAVGMVVGIGYAGARMALSLLVLGVVALLSVWERRFIDAGRPSWATVTFREDGGKTLIKLREAFEAHSFARNKYSLDMARQLEAASEASLVQPSAHAQMRIRYSNSGSVHREFLFYIASLD